VSDTNTPELLDQARAREVRDLMRDAGAGAYQTMIDNLERDLAKYTLLLQTHTDGAPMEDVRRVAHSLKGGSRAMGARALGELFATLEQHAKAGDINAARHLHEASGAAIASSMAALRELNANV
jgi:HPt (histidine-containing phosphotransfer) domain-containing protein